MTGTEVALALLGGALAGTGTSLLTHVFTSSKERRDRHREHFSKALQAAGDYEEFPYVVRRRGANDPEAERLRISGELREVQSQLTYHAAWLLTESKDVGEAFAGLVKELRGLAGGQIHAAWDTPPISQDEQMNISDIGPHLAGLRPLKDRFIEEVSDHLSLWPRWLRRFIRKRRSK